MKKLIIGLCLMANMVMAAGTSSWHYVMSDGTNALVWMGASATNYLSTGTNAGAFVSTNEWRDIILTGKVSIVDAVETNQPVTLAQLGDAIGGLSVLYASTNKTFAISNYYDARTFLPTHTNSIITTASVTGGMYLAGWISNTNLVSEIRHGVAVITARMMFNSGGGRALTVKPEIYIRYADNTEPELFETAQQVTLTGTMTEYMTSIDCSTNVLVPPDARLLVKWKAVSANNTPTWSFECGTGYVIAVRMPVASPLTLNARYADVAGFASNATASLSDAGTNYFRNAVNLTNLLSANIATNWQTPCYFVAMTSVQACAAGQYVDNLVLFTNRVIDTHNGFSVTTKKYTFPVTGKWEVATQLSVSTDDGNTDEYTEIVHINSGGNVTQRWSYACAGHSIQHYGICNVMLNITNTDETVHIIIQGDASFSLIGQPIGDGDVNPYMNTFWGRLIK